MVLTSLILADLLPVPFDPFPGECGDHGHPPPVDPAYAEDGRIRRCLWRGRRGTGWSGGRRPDEGPSKQDGESVSEKFRDRHSGFFRSHLLQH